MHKCHENPLEENCMRWKHMLAVLLGLLMIGTISKNVNAAVYVNENWVYIKYAIATNWGHTITYKIYNSGNLQLQWYIPPQEGINPRYIFVASTSAKSTATYGEPLPICNGEYIIQKIGGSKYMAILSDPKSLSYAGADPWNGDHNYTLVKQVAYDSLSVALDLLNSYVTTAKDIGQLMLPEGIDWVKVQVPTKYHGKVIIEKMSYNGQSVELYVITPEGLAKYGKLLGIPNDLIEHFTKMDKPLYLIKNPNNVQVKVG